MKAVLRSFALTAIAGALSFFAIPQSARADGYYNMGFFHRTGKSPIALRGCMSGMASNAMGVTANLNPSTVPGDFVVIALGVMGSTSVTPATGYTTQYFDNSSGGTYLLAIYTRAFISGDTLGPYFNFFTANYIYLTCSYENVTGVDGSTGTDSANAITSTIPSASAAGPTLTTTHSNEELIAVYWGYIFNGTATSLIYPGSLHEEQAFDASTNYMWFSDESVPGSGTSLGTMTAIPSQNITNAGAQILLY